MCLTSRIVKESISIVLSPPVCGTLLRQPEDTALVLGWYWEGCGAVTGAELSWVGGSSYRPSWTHIYGSALAPEIDLTCFYFCASSAVKRLREATLVPDFKQLAWLVTPFPFTLKETHPYLLLTYLSPESTSPKLSVPPRMAFCASVPSVVHKYTNVFILFLNQLCLLGFSLLYFISHFVRLEPRAWRVDLLWHLDQKSSL